MASFQNPITQFAPLIGGANKSIVSGGIGTAGEVWTSNGAGVAPTFQTASSGGTPSFSAYVSSSITNPTGDGTAYTVIFDSTLRNVGSAYNTANGIFTASTTGLYHFDTTIAFNAPQATSTTVVLTFNGSVYQVRAYQLQGATTALAQGLNCVTCSLTIPMTAADTMSIQVNVGGVAKNVSLFGSGIPAGAATVFSGYKVA